MSDKQKKEVESRQTEPKNWDEETGQEKKPVKKRKKGKKSGKGFIILFIVIVILFDWSRICLCTSEPEQGSAGSGYCGNDGTAKCNPSASGNEAW